MSQLERQVRLAQRRLNMNVLLERLVIVLLIAGGVWGVLTLIERLLPPSVALWAPLGLAVFIPVVSYLRQRPAQQTLLRAILRDLLIAAPALGALAIAPVVAKLGFNVVLGKQYVAIAVASLAVLGVLSATIVARVRLFEAAVALDQAAGLKERLSTALTCRTVDDPFARAAAHDADVIAGKVHVRGHIPVRSPILLPWAAFALATSLALFYFLPAIAFGKDDAVGTATKREAVKVERKNINDTLEEEQRRLKELAKEHPALADLNLTLPKLDELDPNVLETPADIRREAVKRFESVAEQLEKAKDEVGEEMLAAVKRQLAQLQRLNGDDAASQLSDALSRGDFAKAQDALSEMQKQLEEAAKNADDPQQREKMAQMQEQLSRLSEQMKQMDDMTAMRKELEKNAGLSEEEAKKLAEQLKQSGATDPKQIEKMLQKQLAQQNKQMTQQQMQKLCQKLSQCQKASKSCQNLAKSLAQAAQSMSQCQNGGNAGASQSASSAMSSAGQQLSQMEMAEQLLNDLESQLSQLDNLKDGVCQGNCQGQQGGQQRKSGMQGPNAGTGWGSRIGKSDLLPHDFKSVRAAATQENPEIIGEQIIVGPQDAGEATAEAQEAVSSAVRDAQDAIERERVPRQYHAAMKAYFERLAGLAASRGGNSDDSASADESTEADDAESSDE